MTDFRWRDSLSGHSGGRPVLVGGSRAWSADEVLAELDVLRERLAPSRVLGVLADNGAAWAMADLAAQDAGIVHLPLPGFFSPTQLRHAIEQTATDTILTDQPERVGALDLQFAITGTWQNLIWMRRVVEPADLPAGTAKISFTSGSTGAPKGVCLSANGLRATARAVCARLADLPLERHLAVLPLSLLLENVAGLYAPLLRGMTMHLPSLADLGWRGMAGFDPRALDAAVRTGTASSLILVPELLKAWTMLLAHTERQAPETLRFVAVGGARVAHELLSATRQRGIPAHQGYGLTECGSVVTLNRPDDDTGSGDDVGRPLDHARVRVDGNEVMVGTAAFLGYVGGAVGTDGEFPTGDLGELDQRGHLRLTGRCKNLLITSYGRNISPEWVEAALLAQPAILQAIVVGDGRPAPAAIIVAAPGTRETDIDAAILAANQTLPDYARVAHRLLAAPFTPENGLATGNGRPMRSAIIEHHAAQVAALYAQEESEDVVL